MTRSVLPRPKAIVSPRRHAYGGPDARAMHITTALSSAEAASWVAAVGTVSAVVFALWFQWWRARQRRPQLTMEFDDDADRANVEQQADSPQEPKTYRSHWIRPRVMNKRGKDSAEDVEVLLVGVKALDHEPGTSLEPPSERLLEGLPLRWSELNSTKASLPPGTTRRFDLLHVDNMTMEASGEKVEGGAPIRFDVYPTPRAKYHRAFGRKYKVIIAVTARDTDAAFYGTVIAYDLKWHETTEEMRAALTVEPLRGPEADPAAV
jgi:hypothetical protein